MRKEYTLGFFFLKKSFTVSYLSDTVDPLFPEQVTRPNRSSLCERSLSYSCNTKQNFLDPEKYETRRRSRRSRRRNGNSSRASFEAFRAFLSSFDEKKIKQPLLRRFPRTFAGLERISIADGLHREKSIEKKRYFGIPAYRLENS